MVSQNLLYLHKSLYDVRWYGAEGDFEKLQKEFVSASEAELIDLEIINEMLEQLYIPPYKEHMLPKHLSVKSVGRPSLGVTKKVSVTLPENIWNLIEAKQRQLGVSRSQTLRTIIQDYFYEHDSGSH